MKIKAKKKFNLPIWSVEFVAAVIYSAPNFQYIFEFHQILLTHLTTPRLGHIGFRLIISDFSLIIIKKKEDNVYADVPWPNFNHSSNGQNSKMNR